MRAGTQTLIQAIQAIPWTDEPEADDEAIAPMAISSDSSDDDRPSECIRWGWGDASLHLLTNFVQFNH